MLPFAGAVVFANAFPFDARSSTQTLSIPHLPIVLWLVVGVAYAGGRWFSSSLRMDFVRFLRRFVHLVRSDRSGWRIHRHHDKPFNAIDISTA
jgi:hypothetical protein